VCFASFVQAALLVFSISFNLPQVGPDTLLKPPQPQGKGFQKQSSIRFSFDASYSSMDDAKPVATQTMLFDNVGRFALDNALKGECHVTSAGRCSQRLQCPCRLQRQHVRVRTDRHRYFHSSSNNVTITQAPHHHHPLLQARRTA
jgi:hypothetical protein